MRRAKFITLFSVAGIYFFSMFQRIAVPGTIFNELQSSFAVSAAAVAALGAIYLYIYGGMQIFAGILADSIGSSKTLITGGVLLSAGSIFFPFSGSPQQLYLARAVVGLGASLIYISMLKHIDITFSEKNFPLVFSSSILAGYSGGLAGTYPFERLVEYAGWKESLIIAGAICLLLVTFSSLRLRKTFSYKKTPYSLRTVQNIFQNRRIRPIIASGSSNFSVYFLLQATIGKKMLEDLGAFSSSEAASFTFWMMFTTMASVLFHGFAGKKTGKRKAFCVTAASLTACGAALILLNLIYLDSRPLFLIGYLMCAWAGGNILNATLVKETNAQEASGTAVGVYNGAMYTSVALTANIAGVVMDMFKEQAKITPEAIIYPVSAYIAIFSGCAVLGIFSIASSLKIKEPERNGKKPAGQPLPEE